MLKTKTRFAFVGVMMFAVAHGSSQSRSMPAFEVDATWPALPHNWVMGVVSSVAVDRRDHVWILQRPRSVPEALKERAAPAVLEFDADGRFVNAWGGPAAGFDWPDNEHGISPDDKDNLWIGGSSATTTPTPRSDDMLLKFTNKGKFLMQIGARSQNRGNADTKNLRQPADAFVYPKAHEIFVADGYGNRRVVVFDAESGAFKRMWGAFGNVPEDAPPAAAPARAGGGRGRQAATPLDTEGPGSPQFSNPVHSIKISNDDLVYVADRTNRRIQIFTPAGKYVTQMFINRAGPAAGSVAGLAFSPDRQQEFLYAADYGNSHVVVIDRKKLEVLYQFGTRSAKPGDFQGPHHIAVDSKGNIYTAEVAPGNRAQKFLFKGMSSTRPPNALP
jgi:DNA-binding beta-propeller fold protein YncE